MKTSTLVPLILCALLLVSGIKLLWFSDTIYSEENEAKSQYISLSGKVKHIEILSSEKDHQGGGKYYMKMVYEYKVVYQDSLIYKFRESKSGYSHQGKDYFMPTYSDETAIALYQHQETKEVLRQTDYQKLYQNQGSGSMHTLGYVLMGMGLSLGLLGVKNLRNKSWFF